MAAITLSPTEGSFPTTITVTGTSFAISTDITIKYAGISVDTTPSTVTTDGSGGFSATIVTPNYVYDENTISATDGTTTVTADFTLLREPEYCQPSDVADWLRIDINANTDPNTTMIKRWIIENEDEMDRVMGHTFLSERQVTEVLDVNRLWDWGRGLPLLIRHRSIKTFDVSKGDKLEVWNGSGWVDQSSQRIYFEEIKGTVYVKGYLFTILTKSRFRITYRYGGTKEMQKIPKDVKRCCVLMTSMNVLETDFQMSQIPYGGEGNVDKDKIMDRWQKRIDRILRDRSEIISIW